MSEKMKAIKIIKILLLGFIGAIGLADAAVKMIVMEYGSTQDIIVSIACAYILFITSELIAGHYRDIELEDYQEEREEAISRLPRSERRKYNRKLNS